VIEELKIANALSIELALTIILSDMIIDGPIKFIAIVVKSNLTALVVCPGTGVA